MGDGRESGKGRVRWGKEKRDCGMMWRWGRGWREKERERERCDYKPAAVANTLCAGKNRGNLGIRERDRGCGGEGFGREVQKRDIMKK